MASFSLLTMVQSSAARRARQSKSEDGAAARFVAGGDPALVIFDDALANRQSEPGAMRFAVGGEGLEQLAGDRRGDARAAILNFGDHLAVADHDPKQDLSPFRHGIGRIMNEVVKD